MALPNISDLKTYIGGLLTNVEWDFNCNKIISFLTSGTWDTSFNSWAANSNCDMQNSKIINLGTPTSAGDAANKNYVDNNTIPAGYLWGFQLTKNATTPNTDIDISQGVCQSATNTLAIITTTTITKRASVNWSYGTGNGMLDTGSFAASSTYYIFVISKADGTTDILSSLSATNPLLPTGYTSYRKIGAIKTDGSTHIAYVGFSPSDWVQLQGGLILQWGENYVSPNSTLAVTLPTTYPNAHLQCVSSNSTDLNVSYTQTGGACAPTSTSQITLLNIEDNITCLMRWFSIGY